MGASADGKWDLSIQLPGQEPRRFVGLAVSSPKFKNLTWTGWCSMATQKTAFYLDNVQVKND